MKAKGLTLLLALLFAFLHGRLCAAAPSFLPDDVRWDRRFAPPGVQGTVLAMAFDHERLYVGGGMQSIGRILTSTVAEGDGQHWRDLPGGPTGNPLLTYV